MPSVASGNSLLYEYPSCDSCAQLIRHLIGRDFPAMDISPEPSTDTFRAVMAGAEERTINGAAVCIVDELPFGGLGKFGAPFLSKFQVNRAAVARNLFLHPSCFEPRAAPWKALHRG